MAGSDLIPHTTKLFCECKLLNYWMSLSITQYPGQNVGSSLSFFPANAGTPKSYTLNLCRKISPRRNLTAILDLCSPTGDHRALELWLTQVRHAVKCLSLKCTEDFKYLWWTKVKNTLLVIVILITCVNNKFCTYWVKYIIKINFTWFFRNLFVMWF